MGILTSLFGTYSKRETKRLQPILQQVLQLEDKYKELSDSMLRAQTDIFREKLSKGDTLDDILPDAFAVCREAAWRVLGEKHYPVQILGGILLHQGRISEMRTGEGKTLVSTLPAYLNALSGKGVHIVTVNDYLAKRDSEWMGKIYRFLGLTVGLVVHGLDNTERKSAYNADITYGTNNELGFDYLRDNMVIYKELKVQRGHNFAIIDEVDSILIDEARTPLIISGRGDKSTELYSLANKLARTLKMVKVAQLNEKEDNDSIYENADFIVDEKAKSATLTKNGIKKVESFFNIENLTDPDNLNIQHHVNQAIKAKGVIQRDIDYVVKDGEVIIVDEFTGRLMYGRRYNEGLHQAIEAKEGVKIAKESKTLATITFQNYFRLYKKLSGMTGTALTEEAEFKEIYSLDVVEVPTNKPVARIDSDDTIYKTERAKFSAVVEDVEMHHANGQPILVGTVSIEKSELLSKMLKAKGIKHEVLNAKYHEKEAEIVSQAGHLGAVTIATNMAGRGTDIKLGGNSEFMAKAEMRKMGIEEGLINEATSYSETDDEEIINSRRIFKELESKYSQIVKTEAEKVKKAGGLYIIGTERHESRRIDNQLRGRAGRQGDPGESRFYISLEDDLMRLFGGERISSIMDRMSLDESQPIENSLLSRSIENAQKNVEGRNFGMRKNLIQYDDVLNRQRNIIYQQRDQVLDGMDMKEQVIKMLCDSIDASVAKFLPKDSVSIEGWNFEGLRMNLLGWLIDENELIFSNDEIEIIEPTKLAQTLKEKAIAIYQQREEKFGSDIMRQLEHVILLKNVDTFWMDHIDAMEELKRGIRLRAYAQRDPVVEYRVEGFDMFDEMIAEIRENTAKMILTAQIKSSEEPKREQVAEPLSTSLDEQDKKTPVRKERKPGRNDPCPCGSGLKYKKCHGRASAQ